MNTLGLETFPNRCEMGFADVHHPDLCNCSDLGEYAVFVRAVREVAAENGGTVYQSDRPDGRLGVRSRLRGRIEPKHVGTLYRRAKSEGLLADTGEREKSDDVAGKNSDKLDRIYVLRGAA